MKSKMFFKIFTDILMILMLFLLMGYQFFGKNIHECIGIGIFFLFITHNILNRKWYKNMFKYKNNTLYIMTLIVNSLLIVLICAQIYSGVAMSSYIFSFLPTGNNMVLARRIHILGAYWGFILISIHLGIHWNVISGTIKKAIRINKKLKRDKHINFIITLAVSMYGLKEFIDRNLMNYMFLKNEFVSFDYSEAKKIFYIDYIAIMIFYIFVTYYMSKFIREKNKKLKF